LGDGVSIENEPQVPDLHPLVGIDGLRRVAELHLEVPVEPHLHGC